jgi:hypothetical protein
MSYVTADPLLDLPEDLHREMRDLLARVAAAGCPIERNPQMPSFVGTMVEGRMFQIGVAYTPDGVPSGVTILGPGQPQPFGDPKAVVASSWDREMFLALLPEPATEAPPEIPAVLRHLEIRPDVREFLGDIRDELRAIRTLLEGKGASQ